MLNRRAARALAAVVREITGTAAVAVVRGRVGPAEVTSWAAVLALGARILGSSARRRWSPVPDAAATCTCFSIRHPEPVTLVTVQEAVRPPPTGTAGQPVDVAARVARRMLVYLREEPVEAAMRAARWSALEAQIRPHFLFNALTTIQACVRERPALAEELIGSLAHFVRTVLSRGEGFVFVAQELTLVQTYLGLERARLGGRLRTILDIEPATLGLRVPSLVLQPLVENAVVHAVAQRRGGGTLRVVVRASHRAGGQYLLLLVADDGPGLDRTAWAGVRGGAPDRMEAGLHVGLRNVQLRLQAIYEDRARLRLLRRPGGGTIAAVVLPVGVSKERGPASKEPGPGRRYGADTGCR